jgi:hypothetical protein
MTSISMNLLLLIRKHVGIPITVVDECFRRERSGQNEACIGGIFKSVERAQQSCTTGQEV